MSRNRRQAVVLDFDGTVLRKPNQSVFHLIKTGAGLSDQTIERIGQVQRTYMTKALDGTLTRQEERAWLEREARLWINDGLTTTAAARALADSRIRRYVGECLVWLKQRRIPVAIVSFGIRPFIKMALCAHGLADLVDQIYALELTIDFRTGRYTGFLPDTMVLPSTKGTWSHQFARQHRVPLDRLMAVGDTPGDRLLGHLKCNRFGLAKDQDEAERLRPHFHEVAVTEDFRPAWTWLKRRLR